MRELQQRQKVKRLLYSTPSLILLLVVTILIVRGTVDVFKKRSESAQYVAALKDKVAQMTTEEGTLTDNIQSLQTEAGFEKEVKSKYNVAKPGEHVVILIDPQATSTAAEATDTPWYTRVWNAILNAL